MAAFAEAFPYRIRHSVPPDVLQQELERRILGGEMFNAIDEPFAVQSHHFLERTRRKTEERLVLGVVRKPRKDLEDQLETELGLIFREQQERHAIIEFLDIVAALDPGCGHVF